MATFTPRFLRQLLDVDQASLGEGRVLTVRSSRIVGEDASSSAGLAGALDGSAVDVVLSSQWGVAPDGAAYFDSAGADALDAASVALGDDGGVVLVTLLGASA